MLNIDKITVVNDVMVWR